MQRVSKPGHESPSIVVSQVRAVSQAVSMALNEPVTICCPAVCDSGTVLTQLTTMAETWE